MLFASIYLLSNTDSLKVKHRFHLKNLMSLVNKKTKFNRKSLKLNSTQLQKLNNVAKAPNHKLKFFSRRHLQNAQCEFIRRKQLEAQRKFTINMKRLEGFVFPSKWWNETKCHRGCIWRIFLLKCPLKLNCPFRRTLKRVVEKSQRQQGS
jgi:hypothetical protein